MKLKDSLAFDAADTFCECEEGEYCVASAYSAGYVAGFEKARQMAVKVCEECDDHYVPAFAKIGEEEV